jgi:hypothetical protein
MQTMASSSHKRLTGQTAVADAETLINTGWLAEAIEVMRANPLGATSQMLERMRPRFPVAVARIEVLRWLAHIARVEPAILDTIKGEIGPEEKWDISTPSRLPILVDRHTKLIG